MVPPETAKTAVKLNLKQNLLMNQVVEIYTLKDALGEPCRNHSQELAMALRNLEEWALKMFDSSSKLQAGILHGNLFDFGDYRQCISISQVNLSRPLRGKHCTLKLHPDEFLLKKVLSFRGVSTKRWSKIKVFVQNSTLSWSICVPDSCEVPDVLPHFQKLIKGLTEGLNLSVSLRESDCLIEDRESFSSIELVVIFGSLLYVAGIGAFTIADALKFQSGVLEIFSLRNSVRKILAQNYSKGDLDCIHGLRVLSTCYVIIGHRYLMMMFFPVVNSLQIMDVNPLKSLKFLDIDFQCLFQWILYYRSTAITGGTLCVDTFFMISGMLVSTGYFTESSKRDINWAMFYFYRFLRITPPLAVVVLWHCMVIQHFGSGPLWNDMLDIVQKPCQEYWWATVLHIQNYIHPYPLCLTQTWYLTCDMQYYFLSPIILIPLKNHKALGLINLALIYAVSVMVNFYLAWVNEYNGAVPVTNQLFGTKYFQFHYIAPHVRASTYIIGLGLGYILHRRPREGVKIRKIWAAAGWIASIIAILASLIGCHIFFLEDHVYNQLESSLFLAISRSTWTLGIAWIVWACVNGYGGLINDILSLHAFRILGRISYGMYLLHMGIQYMMSGAAKTPGYFSDFLSLHAAMADLCLMVAVGFLFTILFEAPLVQGLAFLIGKRAGKAPIKVQPVKKLENA
ncbi:nose resistant to fluoxetine protein 6-like [Euwallacea fornicatus]|uniref:nose resistant to fluoxetine protein 6-like n=1 Tax=Euwallacea fornicatus TaxID=995702 RepID=UPI0033904D47